MRIKMYLTLLLLTTISMWTATLQAAELKKANLVCFVRFADETDAENFAMHDFAHYQTLFNGTEPGTNTVYNYFLQASYGKLQWTSVFFPQPADGHIVSYQTQQPRSYYEYKSSINPNGYDVDDATAMAARERALVKEIIAYLDANMSADAVIDADGDGLVDNLTIIFSGPSERSPKYLLWPKRSDLVSATGEFQIKGKRVVGYILTFDRSNGFDLTRNIPINTGVLCHEMSHSLGTYDLYHVSGNLNPVGVWDLMSDNQESAQNMTVYTKWRYCKWLDEEYGTTGIPVISQPGTYTLNPVGGSTSENIAYKIQPVGSDEYFVVEYRKKEGFDSNLPGEGLLVYRINPKFSGGNVGYNGTTRLDEQYIFRPGGTTTADGNISQATFSKESGRTAFGGLADNKPFYSDGTTANFAIGNVSACGETLTFDLLETAKQLILSESSLTLKGAANSGASLTVASDEAWTITGIPTWLTVSPTSGDAGTTTVTLTANEDNTTGAVRTAELTVSSTADATLSKTLTVSQEAKASNVILFDDFENTENPNGWVIENSGEAGTGWQYCEGTTTGKAKKMVNSGTHAMLMKEAFMGGAHQVSVLTSKEFANATAFSFYSHSNGGNMAPTPKPTYIIEVSSDGGATWTQLFDVLKDYPRDAEGKTVNLLSYTKISFDLTPYKSEHMKIRFNCADADNDGLNYWWQIDDLEISAEAPSAIRTVTSGNTNPNTIYNLNGQRVDTAKKGLYIVNGRKVNVK